MQPGEGEAFGKVPRRANEKVPEEPHPGFLTGDFTKPRAPKKKVLDGN